MILVIDNYDSFTFNLVHYLIELGADVRVERNDALTASQALATGAEAILIFRVDDRVSALIALQEQGLHVLDGPEVHGA